MQALDYSRKMFFASFCFVYVCTFTNVHFTYIIIIINLLSSLIINILCILWVFIIIIFFFYHFLLLFLIVYNSLSFAVAIVMMMIIIIIIKICADTGSVRRRTRVRTRRTILRAGSYTYKYKKMVILFRYPIRASFV